MKKRNVKLILSIVFSVIAIISFLLCAYLFGWYIYELNKIPPECSSNFCVNIEGEPIILLFYIVVMMFAGVFDILAITFSISCRKQKNYMKTFIVNNVAMTFIEIVFLVLMIVLVNA